MDALARVLKDPGLGNFGSVRILRDGLSHTVANQIEAFFFDSRRNDFLLLYFSGHGIRDDDGYLRLASANTSLNLLDSTSVSSESLHKYMRRSSSQKKVLILDCCFGGAFAKGMMPKAVVNDVGIQEYFQGSGIVVMTASNSLQYSFEGEVLHGEPVRSIFTNALIEGIETGKADVDGDGRISVVDAYRYAEGYLADHGFPQKPRFHASDLSGEILLSNARLPKRLPNEYASITKSPLRFVRMLSAGYLGQLIEEQEELRKPALESLLRLREDSDKDVATLAQQIHNNPKLGHFVHVVSGVQTVAESLPMNEFRSLRRKTFPPGISRKSSEPDRVFLNLPYSLRFANLYVAYIAGVTAFGLIPVTVLGVAGGLRRLDRVIENISTCRYSLHDVTEINEDWNRMIGPRWNRALELGITIAMSKVVKDHRWFVLDKEPRRTQKVLSDLNGVDPYIHDGTVTGVLRGLMGIFVRRGNQPSIRDLTKRYRRLKEILPALTAKNGRHLFELSVQRDLVLASIEYDRKLVESS